MEDDIIIRVLMANKNDECINEYTYPQSLAEIVVDQIPKDAKYIHVIVYQKVHKEV